MPLKGYKQTKEHRQHLSEAHKGIKLSEETKRKMSERFKREWAEGKRIPIQRGKKNPNWKGGLPNCLICGKQLSQRKSKTNKCISCFGKEKRGNTYNWIKDRTKLQKYNDDNKDRRSGAYNYWRKQVYERDNWQCKMNNQNCSGRIIAHHILSWSKYPELRYDVNNGITLCQTHHPRKRVEEKALILFLKRLALVSQLKF